MTPLLPADPGEGWPTGRSVARLLAVLAGAAALALAAGLLVASGLARWAELRSVPSQAWAPDQLVGLLARLAGGLLLGWLAAGSALALLSAVPTVAGRTAAGLAERVTPRLLRSVVAAAVGGSLTFGSAAAAVAAAPTPGAWPTATAGAPAQLTAGAASHPTAGPTLPQLPEPGWTPDPPPAPPPTRPADVSLVSSAGSPAADDDEPIVVRRGDTLWAIAARHLGPGADPAEIAREWPRWYAANRAVIGADPDLLQPGQRLTAPTHR